MWIAVAIAIMAGLYSVLVKTKAEAVNYNRSIVPGPIINWEETVSKYAGKYGVPFDIAMSVMWVESAGDQYAEGSAGEKGLYQLKEIAVLDLEQNGYGSFWDYDFSPEENIQAGIAFLDLQKKRTGNWEQAIKAYNQGQAGAKKYPGRAADYFAKVNEKRRFFK